MNMYGHNYMAERTLFKTTMKKPIAAGIGLFTVALAFAAKDPVIMTINGVDVPKSEFEYLYNKNSAQQVNPQTLEEYLEMFKLYKMKVADAKAEGLDTLPSFLKETDQYRHDLAAPYMVDSAYLNQLVQEAFDRSKREVDAYHIMLFKTRDAAKNVEARQRMDSIKQVLDNGGDFADLAQRFSQDRGSSAQGGHMGWIVAGKYPYSFEVVDFALPEGKISDVVESPVGYHVLKGGKSREARGRVKASHILLLAKTDQEKAAARVRIDSIYGAVKGHPEKFADLAKRLSQDPGSARQGGQLPWFGTGEMVGAFDSVAFAMPVGEISEPFATPYGYHIVYKQEARAGVPFETFKKAQLSRMNTPQDERNALIRKHLTDRLAAKYKVKENAGNLEAFRNYLKTNGIDSTFVANWVDGANSSLPLFTIGKKSYNASEVASRLKHDKPVEGMVAVEMLQNGYDSYLASVLLELEEDDLAKTEPEYRNLLKEYVDGSLLYEVSVRKVWDKAANDTEGLNEYFAKNKAKYTWDKPHVKGYFVQTVNDSVAGLIRQRMAELPDNDDLAQTIRKEFPKQVAIEKVLVAKGGNPMVDHVAFQGPDAESSIKAYPVYFMVNARILNAPEEVADVKGTVTSDYQNEFQAAWEKELRSKYPVKVNEKVLKSVKRK